MKPGPKPKPLAARLARLSVRAPSGCWIWLGSRHSQGYGLITLNDPKRTQYAHRVSYELHVGPIPEGMVIDHLCRREACIRPEHLQAVTQQVNVRRGSRCRGVSDLVCKRGHSRADHGYVLPDNGRRCRLCDVLNTQDYRRRKRARLIAAAVAAGDVPVAVALAVSA